MGLYCLGPSTSSWVYKGSFENKLPLRVKAGWIYFQQNSRQVFLFLQLIAYVFTQENEGEHDSSLQGPLLLPLPSAMLPHCSVLRCTTTFLLSCWSWGLLLGHTQHNLGHGSSCPCQEPSAQRWKHNPVKLTVVNGACSEDAVNLFYSILNFLNEAPSYVIGHLHLGLDAKWFFNTSTGVRESKQAKYLSRQVGIIDPLVTQENCITLYSFRT